jgi:FtsP/CotA-like multicopper oxidase with cupredoxin domain
MYFNVFGQKVSRRVYKEMQNAAKNRQELIKAGLTSRRDLFKMGLLTAGGMLVAKNGLSARAAYGSTGQQTTIPPSGSNQNCLPGSFLPAGQAASPSTSGTAFTVALNVMPATTQTPVAKLVNGAGTITAPTIAPNTAAGEVRAASHQAPELNPTMFPFPPSITYQMHQRQTSLSQTPSYPNQTVWGFNDGTHGTLTPGPTYVAHYGAPQLTRNINALPPLPEVGGFGMPSVTTHLHNAHNPSESDGNPCDFYGIGNFCDQYYPNVLAGFNSTNPPNGDINEALSTLWYHDHRVDFTSQNTYKGLFGFYCLFNQFDTGNEETGFQLPSFPQFDIQLAFADKVYNESKQLYFDLFTLDGIIGDQFLVNGQVQPFFSVEPRRYRFRLLDTGPSRFYSFFLTNLSNLNAVNNFWVIANDGNLLQHPVEVSTVRIGPAERVDIIIDFSQFKGQTIYLENRLLQFNGQGPVPPNNFPVANAGQNPQVECPDTLGNGTILSDITAPTGPGSALLLKFIVSNKSVTDNSVNPATNPTFYTPPSTNVAPRIIRTFKFDRLNGQWSVNGQFMDCNDFRFTVSQNSTEQWVLTNLTGDWTHPIHIHLEEHQILSRNGAPPTLAVEQHARKDVTEVHPNERVQLFFRFRDWVGKYPIHCHNVVHEDHAMMALWHIVPNGGDNINVP